MSDVERANLALPTNVVLDDLGPLRLALLASLDRGAATFDAGAVTMIDAAGLQLLCAAVATARGRGLAVRWTAVPERMRTAAVALGVAAHLGLEPAAG